MLKSDQPLSAANPLGVGRFLAFFLVFFVAATLIADVVAPASFRGNATATLSQALLDSLGHSSERLLDDNRPVLVFDERAAIMFSDLCTGFLEMLILAGAILATEGATWKKRIAGALAGIFGVLVLNQARIVATALLILGGAQTGLVDIAHNVFFRLFLLASIVGLYYAWLRWAVKKGR